MIDPETRAAIIKEERIRIARLGGQARAKAMSAAERRKSALKASKAAAKVRTRKAKQRKAAQS